MVEKLAANSNNNNNRSMKSNKKGGRGSMSNRHLKNTKVQNNFSCGGSNSLNWRTETTKNAVNESNNYGYTNHYVASAFYMLIGLEVEIQKSDGIIYEGILETVSNKVEFHLSHACEKNPSSQDGVNKNEKCKKIIFPFCDVVYCKACNVDLDFARRDTLLTDSAITGTNGAFNERELVQWQPEDPSDTINSELGENDTTAGWAFDEMMRVNEEEHGVKSTFDSSMSSYMTPLDKGDEEEFRAREKRAEQVAREIQKDPKFKELENVDSGMTEEELFSAVTRASPSNNNNNNNNSNSNNSATNNSNSSSPNNNDGFTTYTGKNYRASRHSKPPQSVVGPRLQRNLRNHDGQNHTSNGNHQVNRNHVSSPQRSQNGNTTRNISYQHQTSPQLPPHARIENHHKIPVGHQLAENIPLMNNIRTQGDVTSANSARTTLTYSAVAMKKNPTSANNNNRVHTAPKPPAMPLQPVVPDMIQPVQQLEAFASIPPPHINPASSIVTNLNSATGPASNVPPPLVTNGHVALQKISQPPCRTPEALAAAKQQVIQDAKKKASLGHGTVPPLPQTPPLIPATTTLVSSQVTAPITSTSPVTSPIHQQPQTQLSSQIQQRQSPLQTSTVPTSRSQNHNIEVTDKVVHHLSPVTVESAEKGFVNPEAKPSEPPIPASVSPKDQRSRGEDGKQFLMKYGRIQTAAEEKKGSSLKELKDFGEHFKLEAKPKKRSTGKSTDGTPKTPELPLKTPEPSAKLKSEERLSDNTDALTKPAVSKTEDNRPVASDITSSAYTSPHSSSHLVVTTATMSPSVTSVSTLVATAVTTVTSMTPLGEPPSPTMKSALNPAAKEFNLNPSAKEFNPGKDNAAPTFSPSPKPTLAKQPSFPGEQVQQMVQQQAYYHSQAVMIHPNGSEVLSPTVQSLPVKQIYARPYMSSGPGGPAAVYSIPTVEFSNNGNNQGPQLIATPQSGFIPAQSMSGQQVIIIHGPNGSYQHVVPGGQSQQYYMQQMIRCVPGHPAGSGVQPNASRVPANFQPDNAQGGAYVLAVSQHAGLVQHQVPGNQHQGYHPPQSPVQSSHIQTQYAMTHQVATSFPQNPQNAAPITYSQGNSSAAYRSPSSIHSVAGQHHPQQPFVMMTHQGQHIQTVAMANNQTYVQGQPHGGGILQNYQAGN